MAGLLSISGLASGLDTENLIEQIMEFERRGVTRLIGRQSVQETILTAFETFETRLLALKTDFQRLNNPLTYRAKSVTSSDEDVLTANASTSAAPGTFTLTVDQLAQAHQIASQGFASKTGDVGTGTFSITVGDRTKVDITVDSSNNTLEGLAEAINNADAGASASIINTGDPSEPFVLLITGEDTGSAERIIVDSNLTGGTEPAFGSVDPAVQTGISGSTTVTSSGNYTGNSDANIFFVAEKGTIGSDDILITYTDGAYLNGTFTLSADYVPGEVIEVVDGLELSFSAGKFKANDLFSVDVTAATIQAPLDAKYTLGNTLGGATGIELTSASNTVTDIIEGLTVDLHKASASPVTINIDNDTETIKGDIQQLVEQYNGFVDLMDEVFFFEEEGDSIGALLGDREAISIYSELQSMLTAVAEGVDTDLKSLGDAGVNLNFEGKLELDEGRLDAALADDPEAVMKLFATSGQAFDPDIRFLGASADTVAYSVTSVFQQGYSIKITQAAEKALISGSQISDPASSPIVIDSSNSGIKVKFGNTSTGDIKISEGSYASGDDLAAEIQAKINADGSLGTDNVVVRYVDDGGGNGHFEFQTAGYGSSATIELLAGAGNSVYSVIGHTSGSTAAGQDVIGTINGEEANGSGQILTGTDNNEYANGLQLLVTITSSELTLQGEDQGYVRVTKGIAAKQRDLIARFTDIEDGDVKVKKDSISSRIESLQDQIDSLEGRLEIRRQRLVAEFLALETALADLQSQQGFLTQGLAGLTATSNSVISRNR